MDFITTIIVQPKSDDWCSVHYCKKKDCTIAQDGFGISGGLCGYNKIYIDRVIYNCSNCNCGSCYIVCFPCWFICDLCLISCGIFGTLCAPCCATYVLSCYYNENAEKKYKWFLDIKKYTKGIWFGSGNHRNPHN